MVKQLFNNVVYEAPCRLRGRDSRETAFILMIGRQKYLKPNTQCRNNVFATFQCRPSASFLISP